MLYTIDMLFQLSPSLPSISIHWSVSNLHDIFQILHSLFSFSHTISSSNQLPPSHNGDVFQFVLFLFCFCFVFFLLILFVATFLFCSFYFCIRLAFVSVCFVISVQWTCFYLIIVDMHTDTCVYLYVCVYLVKNNIKANKQISHTQYIRISYEYILVYDHCCLYIHKLIGIIGLSEKCLLN